MSPAERLRLAYTQPLRLLIEPLVEELLVVSEFEVDFRNPIPFAFLSVGDFEIVISLLLGRLSNASYAT